MEEQVGPSSASSLKLAIISLRGGGCADDASYLLFLSECSSRLPLKLQENDDRAF